jgi:hypothetical protein
MCRRVAAEARMLAGTREAGNAAILRDHDEPF